MGTIRIPSSEELRERLNGIDRLLTAKKWERAAIVFAHTEVQTNKGHGTRPGVSPGKRNIRDFAAQGYQGLGTNKAVSRYREAWITAINNGWAGPVEPGQEVTLPDQPFPAWPYGEGTTWEDVSNGAYRKPRTARPIEVRVISSLGSAASALRSLTDTVGSQPLADEVREQLVTRLTEIRTEADNALIALMPGVTPVSTALVHVPKFTDDTAADGVAPGA